MVAPSFDTFSRELVEIPAGRVCLRRAGSGPVVLLLHGYPETSLAWRKVAPALAREFTVVAADLPGYGDSTWSSGIGSADRISKRMMARMLADAMTELGVPRFAVVGHDRGARVAYRMSLDLPDRSRRGPAGHLPILDMRSGRAIWHQWADQVGGHALPAGHFLMEECPRGLGDQLIPFLAGIPRPVSPT